MYQSIKNLKNKGNKIYSIILNSISLHLDKKLPSKLLTTVTTLPKEVVNMMISTIRSVLEIGFR